MKETVDGNTSTLVSRYSISKNVGGTDSSMHNYSYAYDKNGNITAISENGTQKAAYQYNELNELIREDNAYINKSVTYSYDVGGNLISKTEYAYTTGTLGAPTAVHSYGYGDSNWKDKLTSYDGSAITYDAIGNPLSYVGGWNFTWQQGRKLATAANGQTSISYKYNADGIRTQKTVNGTATNYYLEGGNIAWQTDGTNTIHYTYDSDGDLAYMNLNGNLYYYERNAQNDIIGLVDSNMNEVVTYTYDSWGKLLNIGGSLAGTVGKINPFRYRGYYYDTETGLYYLSSRYYDPGVGRFINADDEDVLTATPSNLTDKNLYSYCDNNPVMRADDDGHFWHILVGAAVGALFGGAIQIASNVIEGKKWYDGLGMALAAGALSGALAATGAGLIAQVVGNAGISMGQAALSGGSKSDIAIAGLTGGLGGLAGGRGCGKLFKSQSKALTKRLGGSFKKIGKGAFKEVRKAAKNYLKNTRTNYKKVLFKGIRRSNYPGGVYSIGKSTKKRLRW